MNIETLNRLVADNDNRLAEWYNGHPFQVGMPIYSSFDIRVSGHKISNVDGNVYPAGFNNIHHDDLVLASKAIASYLHRKYGNDLERIMIVTEEYSNNPYYWENIFVLSSLLKAAGKQTLISFPRIQMTPTTIQSVRGAPIQVVGGTTDSQEVRDFNPQLVLSNNDFSNVHDDWKIKTNIEINPPHEMGWFRRKKNEYFDQLEKVVKQFSSILGIDPIYFQVQTESFQNFDLESDESLRNLAAQVDGLIEKLSRQYKAAGVSDAPFIFIKNNVGTYGLAVVQVHSGAEILGWNYKMRKKMKAAKGGRLVDEVIIQEGIPSRVTHEGRTSEPVIYTCGGIPIGGFLRIHEKKSEVESLNSPGAIFKGFSISSGRETLVKREEIPLYSWAARLGCLAIAGEALQIGRIGSERVQKTAA